MPFMGLCREVFSFFLIQNDDNVHHTKDYFKHRPCGWNSHHFFKAIMMRKWHYWGKHILKYVVLVFSSNSDKKYGILKFLTIFSYTICLHFSDTLNVLLDTESEGCSRMHTFLLKCNLHNRVESFSSNGLRTHTSLYLIISNEIQKPSESVIFWWK